MCCCSCEVPYYYCNYCYLSYYRVKKNGDKFACPGCDHPIKLRLKDGKSIWPTCIEAIRNIGKLGNGGFYVSSNCCC